MSTAPANLKAVAAAWVARGGTNSGIVGSMKTHRGGYHLGKDRIFATGIYPSCASTPTAGECTAGRGWTDYSVQTARDKAGLTDYAAAIDLSGSGPTDEVAFAKWLIKQCQAGAPDTKDIRGVQYEIYRWDRQRGQTSGVYVHDVNEAGHVHIEYYRDSRSSDQTGPVNRYFATQGGIAGGIDVPGFPHSVSEPASVGTVTVPAGTQITQMVDGANVKMPAGAAPDRPCYGVDHINLETGAVYSHGYEFDMVLGGVRQSFYVAKGLTGVVFKPAAGGDTQHTVTLAVDGITEATVTV